MKAAAKELGLDILTNALETGAIDYWTTNVDYHRDEEEFFVTQIMLEVLDEDTQSPVEPRVVHTITPEKVIAAMERIAVETEFRINPRLKKRITEMWATNDYLAGEGGDIESDDAIMQVAALGELTFG